MTNILGDVIGLVDSTGTSVVEYNYDAWGKNLFATGTLATTLGQANPFRYRGYYFDTESGFYYLQSRYYDPNTSRFINADDTSILQMMQGELLGGNLYAYCYNNPVNMVDNNGHLPKWITDFTRGFIDGFGNAAKGLLNAFLQPLKTLKSILSLKNFISGWFSGLTIGWSILFKIVKGDFYNAGVLYGGHIFQAVVVLITYGAVKVAGKIKTMLTSTSVWGNLSKAAQYGLKPYYTLRAAIKNTGLQAHHIIEKRFNFGTGLSVAVTEAEHRVFTSAWRKLLPYGKKYTLNQVWTEAQKVYANFPVLLEAARKELGK